MARRKSKKPDRAISPWPHRTAWLLACATFPLIWMGGLVTSYNAGMAVPNWPGTYRYKVFFLYPLKYWLPHRHWDVFLEHSHRLIGATVGLVSLAVVVVLWRCDHRKWTRWLGLAVVAAVLLQGTLGGLRVLGNDLLLANVHGCTAPLFFALCATVVMVTSRPWREASGSRRPGAPARAGPLQYVAFATAGGVYLQIVLGAQLRHLPAGAAPGWSLVWVWLHVIEAGLVLVGLGWLWILVRRRMKGETMVARRAWLLAALFVLQLALGAATWVTNYGWPNWFREYLWAWEHTVVAEGPLQAWVTTAHVGLGSLNLAAALSLGIWSFRLPGRVEDQDWLAWVADYGRLIRPRILALVLLSMAAAALVAGDRILPWPLLGHALFGAGLVIAGAIALSARLEHGRDARMARTADRPLPSGRLGRGQVTFFGAVLTVVGLAYLGLTVRLTIPLLAAASWALYVLLYIPLKRSTVWQTPVGAVAGAMPTLLGAAAADALLSANALALFGIVCFWQFPHAMAIAWLYRDQFARADVKLATVVDTSGRSAGWLAVLGSGALVPVSLVLWWSGRAGWPYAVSALVLGIVYLLCSVWFLRHADDRAARWLLRCSLVYLPVVFAVLVATSL